MGSAESHPARQTATHRSGVLPWFAALAGFLCFSASLKYEFLNWDDTKLFEQPERVTGFTAANFRWWFTTFRLGHYQPLSWMSYALDMQLGGGDPGFFHLTNLLLHALNCALVTLLLHRIFIRLDGLRAQAAPAALFGGLLFALHPQRVETVAWITTRRDLLSISLLLLSALAYLRAEGQPRKLGLSLLAYGAALFAKVGAFPMPVALLMLDLCPLSLIRPPGKAGWRATITDSMRQMVEKAVYLPLLLPAACVAARAAWDSTAALDLARLSITARSAQAAYGLVYYPAKFVFPWPLSPLYGLPLPLPVSHPQFRLPLILIPLLIIALLVAAKRYPVLLAVSGSYIVLIAPVLGFYQSGPQLVADRYSYLAALPFAALCAGGLARLAQVRPQSRPYIGIFALLWLLGLAALTRGYLPVWHDTRALWEQAIRVEPDEPHIQNYWRRELRLEELHGKAAALQKQLSQFPDGRTVRIQLAQILAELGEDNGALHSVSELLRGGDDPQLRLLRARLFADAPGIAAGRLALADYTRALALNPENPEILSRRGLHLQRLGRPAEAVDDFLAALALQPHDRLTRLNCAIALSDAGKPAQAREQLLLARRDAVGRERTVIDQFLAGKRKLGYGWMND